MTIVAMVRGGYASVKASKLPLVLGQDGPNSGTGVVQGGAPGGQQAPGITLCQAKLGVAWRVGGLVRWVVGYVGKLVGAADQLCQRQRQQGHLIQLIQQPGHHPVQGMSPSKVSKRRNEKANNRNEDDPIRGRLFALAKWETITLHVSFVPEEVPAAEWHHYLTRHEHVFRGDLIVEYPRETSGESATHKELMAAVLPWLNFQ
eukprot:Skav204540  [mRNA]  locus=scaffold3346:13634:15237:- [translate_table: standard]